ncbi:BTAD domain-containing putative transcriptional regulator [Actinophytocola sp.]|uniref:AfsR/SARP family transcriptional regulator n=1 Tax=Actinophytocola sp. TaxID=1872138 RepID=UPI00389B0E61
MDVLVQVLGPLEVRVGGEVLDLGGTRIRTLLATLIANSGRVTAVGTLVSALWGDEAPPGAHRSVRTYVSRLRAALSPAGDALAVVTHPAGYVLRLAPGVLDVARFEELVAAGRQAPAGEPAVAVEHLTHALSLWHGDAYGEFGEVSALRGETRRLSGMRLSAIADRIDAELAVGAGAELIAELTGLTEQHPGHDRLWGQLMRALYRAGRQAEALEVFVRARTVLVERFGIDPSPTLVEIHRQVLENDDRLAAAPVTPPARPRARNDLPGDVADFAGRRAELARLLAAGREGSGALVIEALDGMAGVGKTTLAVRAAHRLTEHYPDAQLFIDLHGHAPNQAPTTPLAALDMLLRAVGVPGAEIPNDLDARAARWRAELAARSMLVVLDNAADSAQVRPLLPGTVRSLALITSRRRLVDLETAQVMSLDVLPERDALELFTGVVGAGRVAGEAAAVREVVELCGYLPLAIRIAAARLRSRPAWTVWHLAERLRRAGSPLAELSTGARSVAAAFALSYENLYEPSRRMFRLLGVHPGPDIDVNAAAALAAVDRADAAWLLDHLVDDHLVQEPAAGRYRLHDLVRQHAHAVALADEPAEDRRAALRRIVDFYLHTAYRGSGLLDQQFPPIDIGVPAADCVPEDLASETAAMTWFDTNQNCVLAALSAAERAGWDTAVWQLAWTLDNFHYRRGAIHDSIASWSAGLAAAQRLDNVAAQSRAHRRLGLVYVPLGEQDTALHHLGQSLALAEKIGDVLGQAGVHFILAFAWMHQEDYRRALPHALSAQNLYHEAGGTTWEIRTLGMIAACHTRLGDHDEARERCESALALCRRHGDVYGQADCLETMGAIAVRTGQHEQALAHYEQALTLWHELDNTYRQAGALTEIGDIHVGRGDHEPAREAWQRAIVLYRAQNLRQAAAKVAARLETGSPPLTP